MNEMDAVTKWCPRCKREMVETAWAPSKRAGRGEPCRKCVAAYRATPKAKAKQAVWRASPGAKATRAVWLATPAAKAKAAAYRSTPEYKSKKAAYQATSKVKAKQRAWHATPEAKAKAADRIQRRLYGISLAEKQALVESQGGVCALCGKPFEAGQEPHTDHDHATGVVRGVLHRECNSALGFLGDDLVGVLNAVRYLSRSL